MKVQFIYTYEGEPQEAREYPFVPPLLKNKQTLAYFATALETDNSFKAKLTKISCCIYGVMREMIPDWYIECNGKLYFENGKLVEESVTSK